MPPRARQPARTRSNRPFRALADIALGVLPLAACAFTTSRLLALPPQYFADVVGIYALLAALIVRFLPPDLPPPGLGAANQITLVRATLVMPVAGLILQPAPPTAAALWWIVALSSVALALDGVDGSVARQRGQETRFGARFDMELDAFLMLVLSMLVWRTGRVAPWILIIGALRYLFVAAGWLWPRLTAELLPSLRRKAICVVQGIGLIVCLAPIVPPELATRVAAVALALLVLSFAIDIIWLIVNAPGHVPPGRPGHAR
jgi:phosphatidylglycerophosphate synthase